VTSRRKGGQQPTTRGVVLASCPSGPWVGGELVGALRDLLARDVRRDDNGPMLAGRYIEPREPLPAAEVGSPDQTTAPALRIVGLGSSP
jgi:hypothetical protein